MKVSIEKPKIQTHAHVYSQQLESIIQYVLLFILSYFILMDICLYFNIQKTSLVEEVEMVKKKEKYDFSLFHPMSIKFLMNDPVSHYVNGPTNYLFNEITNFSEVFYFITPNVITIIHLCVGVTAAKFISSDSLQSRRIGVLFFELRSWLDGFDGTVFRAQSGDRVYQSKRKTFGHIFDTVCDSLSGTLLCIAIWLYLCKCPPMKKQDLLPFTDAPDNKYSTNNDSLNAKVSNSRTFWRVFIYGVGIAAISMAWDLSVYHYSSVLQVKIDDPHRTKLQNKSFHSTSTLFIIWMWRIFGGQAFLQMTLVAVFLDKIWEWVSIMGYMIYVIAAVLVIFSELHIQEVRSYIGI